MGHCNIWALGELEGMRGRRGMTGSPGAGSHEPGAQPGAQGPGAMLRLVPWVSWVVELLSKVLHLEALCCARRSQPVRGRRSHVAEGARARMRVATGPPWGPPWGHRLWGISAFVKYVCINVATCRVVLQLILLMTDIYAHVE